MVVRLIMIHNFAFFIVIISTGGEWCVGKYDYSMNYILNHREYY
jgi:hypothetical protein